MMRHGHGAKIFPHARAFVSFYFERLHEIYDALFSPLGKSNERVSKTPNPPPPRSHRQASQKIRSPDNHLRRTLKNRRSKHVSLLDTPVGRNTVLPMPTLTFKATPQEAQRIRLAARSRRMSMSQYVRNMSLPKNRAKTAIKNIIEHGNVLIARAPDAPLLTNEMMKTLLYGE